MGAMGHEEEGPLPGPSNPTQRCLLACNISTCLVVSSSLAGVIGVPRIFLIQWCLLRISQHDRVVSLQVLLVVSHVL